MLGIGKFSFKIFSSQSGQCIMSPSADYCPVFNRGHGQGYKHQSSAWVPFRGVMLCSCRSRGVLQKKMISQRRMMQLLVPISA
ncbi:hypothetical protein NDU88_002368 [Pleurodeles waltl]|uniref:Uncharacterized protein n=1 Tax=Pleurodeles waltl TaxID=8319 RepID=A0AAV7KSM7_PLEWA|nr:hypothetical protein NDU88_002368 [Pleurodeles waltl]